MVSFIRSATKPAVSRARDRSDDTMTSGASAATDGAAASACDLPIAFSVISV